MPLGRSIPQQSYQLPLSFWAGCQWFVMDMDFAHNLYLWPWMLLAEALPQSRVLVSCMWFGLYTWPPRSSKRDSRDFDLILGWVQLIQMQ